MYIEKELKRGYNEYTSLAVENGYNSLMDVGIIMLETGDTFEFADAEKELAFIVLWGKATVEYEEQKIDVDRPNPFNYSTFCLHQAAGAKSTITALAPSKVYLQKTYNDVKFPTKVYRPEDTHTWRRGADGMADGACERDVRTSFDYENAPYSKMVLGEVVNLPGKWSSYPPHAHPQPEVYFYNFEKPQGFGAGFIDDEVVQIGDNGLAIITKGVHPMSMAPGYACCYVWGIRHFDDNPWEKTRIDDPAHTWMLEPDAKFWTGK